MKAVSVPVEAWLRAFSWITLQKPLSCSIPFRRVYISCLTFLPCSPPPPSPLLSLPSLPTPPRTCASPIHPAGARCSRFVVVVDAPSPPHPPPFPRHLQVCFVFGHRGGTQGQPSLIMGRVCAFHAFRNRLPAARAKRVDILSLPLADRETERGSATPYPLLFSLIFLASLPPLAFHLIVQRRRRGGDGGICERRGTASHHM